MAAKRDIDSVTGTDGEHPAPQPSTKRPRNSNGQKKSKQSQEPATDVTYGQRCCFPGLNETVAYSDEELELEDESDALAYLKSVRQEASEIPHLLVAPRSGPLPPPPRAADELEYNDEPSGAGGAEEGVDRSIYGNGYGDAGGYYEDGAYTAVPAYLARNHAPDHDPDHDHDPDPDPDPDWDPEDADGAGDEKARIDAAYFASLTAHFASLRARLHGPPPSSSALASLTKEQSPHVGSFGPHSKTFTVWSVRVRYSDPHPVQVAAMDKGAVLRLLRIILGGKFLRRGAELRERTSRWLWALLARLPDRGELDYAEVGHVRDLGKRAALLMHSLQEMAALREAVDAAGHGDGVQDGGECDGESLDSEEEASPAAQDEGPSTADDEPSARPSPDRDAPRSPSTAPASLPNASGKPDDGMEDGEVDESVPMDIESDIESAKARLLAKMDAVGTSSGLDTYESSSKNADQQEKAVFDPVRARMNMRATLNMILTVAGEFYGQRDLLEFRDPFHGI